MNTKLFSIVLLILAIPTIQLPTKSDLTQKQSTVTTNTVFLPFIQKPERAWTKTSDGMETGTNIRDFAFSPNFIIDGTVFAATWNHGIYKSTDWGQTWLSSSDGLEYGNVSSILALAISPNYLEDHTIYAGGSYEGIYKSTDGGFSWTCVYACEFSPEGLVRSIIVSTNYKNDHSVFAGTLGGFFRSKDDGMSWKQLNPDSFTIDNTYAIALSPDYTSNHTLIVGTDFIGDGLAKSTDEGDSWTLLVPAVAVQDIQWLPSQDPNNSSIYYSHCIGLVCFSDDFGINWNCNQVSEDDVWSLAVSPINNIVFAGTGGSGVFISIDNGSTWQGFSNGLGNLEVYTLSIDPSNPRHIFSGTADGAWQYTIP